jgi:hypothetical protein
MRKIDRFDITDKQKFLDELKLIWVELDVQLFRGSKERGIVKAMNGCMDLITFLEASDERDKRNL